MYIFLLSATLGLLILDLPFITYIYGYKSGAIVVGLISMVLLLIKSAPKKKTIDAEKVSGWVVSDGLDIDNPDMPKQVSVVIDDKAIDLGFLFVGGPGSGKSIAAIALQQYITFNRVSGAFAYMEGKGDFDIYKGAVTAGAKPDFFFSSELPSSDTINVMAGPTDTVVDYLSRVLVGTESEYYGAAQQAALRKVIPLLKAFGKPCNLMDLWALLTVREASQYLINKAKNEGFDKDIIIDAEQYFNQDEQDRLKAIDGLLNKLYPFISGALRERINAYSPTLDIYSAVANGKRIYFHLPLTQTAKAIATMITETFGVIAKNRQNDAVNKRDSFPLLFDDWGAFFYDNFGPITARCRSAKMPVSFFFQSRGQTDKVDIGRIFTTEIMDNIGGFCALRINGIDSAEWVSKQFGTYESQELSATDSSGFDSRSMQTVDKPRVKPDSLRDMNAGECYLSTYAMGAGGAVRAMKYKVRFPMPETKLTPPLDWPKIDGIILNSECDGVHLWRDFMDKDRLNDIKKQTIENALSAAKESPEIAEHTIDEGALL